MQKIINLIIVILLSLLPISNIIGQYLTNGLGLNQNILLWKEFLVSMLVLIMIYDLIKSKKILELKYVYLGILALIFVLTSSFINSVGKTSLLLGFKFELFWFIFLFIGIDWIRLSNQFEIKNFIKSIYLGFALSAMFSISLLLLGAKPVLSLFKFKDGVSDSANIINSVYCHSINGLGDGCRLSGGFSNPNHYGAYLGMVLPLFVYYSFTSKNIVLRILSILFSLLSIVFIWFNYARFLWLSLVIIFCLALVFYFKNKYKNIFITTIILTSTIGGFVFFSLPFDSQKYSFLPSFITKPGSSYGHYRQTNIAIDIIKSKFPQIIFSGYGLGQSGPAAKEDYQNVKELKIYKENFYIADKYMSRRELLTVPENWYLQLILNGGILYFLFKLVVFIKILWSGIYNNTQFAFVLTLSVFTTMNGNIYLHIWESSIVSIYFCILSFLIIASKKNVNLTNF